MNNWQYELAQSKLKADDELIPVNTPLWANQLPMAEHLRGEVEQLLQQLPLMRTVQNTAAREAYRDQLAKALIQSAYLQARVIQLATDLTTSERNGKIKTIFQHCTGHIRLISNWLSL